MALLFLDSFDHYADADKTTKWTSYAAGLNGDIMVVAAIGARSTQGLRVRTTNTASFWTGTLHLVPSMPVPSGATLVVGFRVKANNPFVTHGTGTDPDTVGAASAAALFVCRSAGTNQWWLRWNSTGTLSVYRGATLLGTTAAALSVGVFSYVEVKVLLSTTVGTVDVRVDAISQLSLTGQNTQNGSSATWDEIRIGHATSAGGGANIDWNIDDYYLADGTGSDWNSFKGDVRVDATYPTSDGSHSDFTLSTGATHFGTVDEALANSDTDYNYTSTVNNIDTLNYPNIPVAGATIPGYQIVSQVKKTDAGAATLKAVSRIGGTDYLGAEYGVPTTYAFIRQPQAVSPATSVALTEAEYNAAEFGVKKIT